MSKDGIVEIQNFIKEAEIFYIATLNGNKPSCRPFGATIIYNDKLYFITKKHKLVTEQITSNNSVCIVACDKSKDYEWIRINCQLISDDDNMDAKQVFLDTYDDLDEEGYRLDNPDFQIFYADGIDATIYDYDGNERRLN